MTFVSRFIAMDGQTAAETKFETLEHALGAIAFTVTASPGTLIGHSDLATVSDAEDGTVVAALARIGDEFVLIRETTDERYADELAALPHDRLDSEGDPYMVFARWAVKKD